MNLWVQTLVSVGIVSLISLVGALFLASQDKTDEDSESLLIHTLIAVAVGALLGDVFIHLWPEAFESLGVSAATYLGAGFAIFFLLEKVLHWRHKHSQSNENAIEPYGIMNLVGDGLHNFIDGALIAAAYVVSLPIGFATTIAVILHEIPQELGDYAILRMAGFSKRKAVFFNFLSALAAVAGGILVLAFGVNIESTASYIIAFTAGGFIYIAFLLLKKLGEDLTFGRAIGQLLAFGVGILLLWVVKFIE